MGKAKRNRKRDRAVLDRGPVDMAGRPRPEGTRFVEIAAEFAEALAQQQQRFREKFGRDPGPDDPAFFDEQADEARMVAPGQLEAEMVRAMHAADIDPALIHAYQVTGLIVTEQNRDMLSDEDILEWEAALDEFERGSQ